jgi:hypothetical protein
MTHKHPSLVFGQDVESQAIGLALSTRDPNPRSPAFALQAIYKLVEKNGVVDARWRLHTRIKEKIETTYRDRVSWNEMLCHWQVGTGTHVPFEEIAKAAIRWYINGWDLTRHTRDTEVQYPEDVELLPWSSEFKHMSDVLRPLSDELTRRIFITNHSNRIYYIDVVPEKPDRFVASVGHFDDGYESHRRCGPPDTLWNLEMKTVFPILKGVRVLSYQIHDIFVKRGV